MLNWVSVRPLIITLYGLSIMKWKVQLYVSGKVFYEEVYAANREDAKNTALARNPSAKLMGVNPIVGS
tara:strand:- start:62 stop:265 length:204 start_codon:yes stop_codon:yes gene_type:complete